MEKDPTTHQKQAIADEVGCHYRSVNRALKRLHEGQDTLSQSLREMKILRDHFIFLYTLMGKKYENTRVLSVAEINQLKDIEELILTL